MFKALIAIFLIASTTANADWSYSTRNGKVTENCTEAKTEFDFAMISKSMRNGLNNHYEMDSMLPQWKCVWDRHIMVCGNGKEDVIYGVYATELTCLRKLVEKLNSRR